MFSEMIDGVSQIVLRCKLCNKPFDKAATLKRHGYYCRSRKPNSTAVRVRSCSNCMRAKARCDHRRPECTRCVTKGVDCRYPTASPQDTTPPGGGHNVNTQASQSDQLLASGGTPVVAALDGQFPVQNDSSQMLDDTLLGSGAKQYMSPKVNRIAFIEANDLSVYGNDVLFPEENGDALHDLLFDAPFQLPYPSPLSRLSDPLGVLQSLPDMSFVASPSEAVRSLVRRTEQRPAAHPIANLILHTLKSYTTMILRHGTLPPFIHPAIASSSSRRSGNMEPLENCTSLMHMAGSNIQGSRKLFWRNVRLECTRLCERSFCQPDPWEILASLQALAIYILLRLDEGETDHNNLDTLLMATVTKLSHVYGSIMDRQASTFGNGFQSSWEDWLLEESTRRVCIIFQAVNLLVYFDPAALCNHPAGVLLAPLPAPKQLWEADNELTWSMERARLPERLPCFGLTTNGDLVKLDESCIWTGRSAMTPSFANDQNSGMSIAQWGEWCAGMDGYGALVMLVASLVAV